MKQSKFEYFLEDHKNKVQAFFEKSTNIEVLDGSCDKLNRYKHAGAQLLVDGVYYYFTTSQFNIANKLYVSLNKGLIEKIKTNQDPYKVVLINRNNFTIFDKWNIIEDNIISDYKNKIPVVSLEYAESIWPLRMLPSTLDFTKLQAVRYSWEDKKNNQLHAKKIRFWSQTYHFDKTFASRQKAWEWLVKCEVYNKAKRQFYKDLKAEDCMIQIKNNGKKEAIHFELIEKSSVSTVVNPKVAQSAPSSILDSNIYNIDDSAPVVQQDIDNTRKKASLLDKQMDVLAEKMADKVGSYTESDILSALLKFGSNENMKNAYILGLYEKKLYKEAEYASKMFTILNNNKIED